MTTEPFLLLDDWTNGQGCMRLYRRPAEIIAPGTPEAAEAGIVRLDRGIGEGLHAAGFLTYELGHLFEARNRRRCAPAPGLPLFWMGLFTAPEYLSADETEAFLASAAPEGFDFGPPAPGLSPADYMARVERVLELIRAGDIYQANLTFPLHLKLEGDPLALYRALRAAQPVAYGGFVRTGTADLLSLSPELFLERSGGRIRVKPMKGTAPRGSNPAMDRALAERLRTDPKSLAENLMIVDLMRNDVGRIARIGSVRAEPLFEVETLPRLHQMTSTVEAELESDAATGLGAMLQALFPCGSITGAPKLRAMEVIDALEEGPRGAYTGAIGFAEPGGACRFNVAIRTAVFGSDGQGHMGVGAGIVADSDPAGEYAECLLKAAFLEEAARPLHLIETMRWEKAGGLRHADLHLARLSRGAEAFAIPFPPEDGARVLAAAAAEAANSGLTAAKVRLTLNRDGEAQWTVSPLPPVTQGWRFALSPETIQSADPFRRHKTSERHLYERELARLQEEYGCDEVLFLNERGECVEGARTNLFVRFGRHYLTPPLASGALPGVLRAALLADPLWDIRETRLSPADLQAADEVLFGNALRGLIPALLVDAIPHETRATI